MSVASGSVAGARSRRGADRQRAPGRRTRRPAQRSRPTVEAGLEQPRILARSCRALLDVQRNRSLRLLGLAWASSTTAEGIYLVVLGVYAYESGGPLAVGLVGLVRMIPAAAAASLGSILADRFARERVLRAVEAMRTALLAGGAVAVFAGAPAAAVLGVVCVHAVVSGPLRPSLKSVLPSLARTPGQLVAANAGSSATEALGMLLGSGLGGVAVATTGAGVGFAVASACCLLASALLVSLRVEGGALRTKPPSRSLGEVLAGFKTLASSSGGPRLIVALFTAQTFVRGALTVLIVVFAVDLPGLDRSWVGLLMAALGAGGIVGALAAAGLAGRPLAGPLLLGLALWGAPIAAIGAVPSAPVALVALATVGVGNALLDVAGNTLLQRIVASDVLGRVFGAFTGLSLATVGLGSIVAPLLLEALGTRGALLATGALLPSVALLVAARVRALDRAAAPPERELALLRDVPMFAPLPVAAAEQAASRLIAIDVPTGQPIICEGQQGNRFYVLAEGQLDITRDRRTIATRQPDDVGEIALLHDVRRTATVTARHESRVYALERAEFLAAVTGHPASVPAGHAVVQQRLTTRADQDHAPLPEPTPTVRVDAHTTLVSGQPGHPSCRPPSRTGGRPRTRAALTARPRPPLARSHRINHDTGMTGRPHTQLQQATITARESTTDGTGAAGLCSSTKAEPAGHRSATRALSLRTIWRQRGAGARPAADAWPSSVAQATAAFAETPPVMGLRHSGRD
jgi:CRP-like cAMP-binding protein/predicted MFS family arabinose efflux permease